MTGINKKYAFVYLLIGFILLFFFHGKWSLPLATFLAPVFLIRFMRSQPAGRGFLLVLLAAWITNIVVWNSYIPISGFPYYMIGLVTGIPFSLALLIDRIYATRLKGIVSTLVLPATYVIMEYILISTNPGGTNVALANTQSSLALKQLIAVTGIWGVTFLIFWTASTINWLWDNSFEKQALRRVLVAYVIPVVLIMLVGQFRLARKAPEQTVRIAAIQVTSQELQHISNGQPDDVNEQINTMFLENCHVAALSGARLVFGIEIMLNMTSDDEAVFLETARAAAIQDHIYIGLPLLIYPTDQPDARPMNKIIWISPEGDILFTYFKAKPTPGEGRYGDGILKYFDSPFGRIGSAICFDMDFPNLIRQAGKMNVDIMLVPGNDWQGITPYHTHAASIRGIENGFNLVRAASRGLSASYNFRGQTLSAMNFFENNERIFYSDVPTRGTRTVYAVLGDYFAWLCAAFLICITVALIRHRQTTGAETGKK